jgi:hypothetical protein
VLNEYFANSRQIYFSAARSFAARLSSATIYFKEVQVVNISTIKINYFELFCRFKIDSKSFVLNKLTC